MITFPRLFKPAVLVTIAGQPVSSVQTMLFAAPRVAFRVTRSMTSTPDTGSVAVYGLAPERRTAMQAIWTELGTAGLTLASGYDGITLRLFSGDVRTLQASVYENAEFVTRATADDAGDALTDAVVPPGLASTAGVSVSEMIQLAIACINAPAAYVPPAHPPEVPLVAHPSVAAVIANANPAALTLFYTSVSVGKARDLLNEAARILGVRWWIRESLLYMTRRQLPIDGLAVALPRSHWLSEPSEDGLGTIRVSTFLDPNLAPGRQVALVGRIANDTSVEMMRIEAGEYTGDTDSGAPFRADLVLRRLVG